jgi:hypothetical protein
MYVNGTAENEVYRFKFATVADYEWNTSAYTPELSLWKALVKAYGPACAKEVLFFNETGFTRCACAWNGKRSGGQSMPAGLVPG